LNVFGIPGTSFLQEEALGRSTKGNTKQKTPFRSRYTLHHFWVLVNGFWAVLLKNASKNEVFGVDRWWGKKGIFGRLNTMRPSFEKVVSLR